MALRVAARYQVASGTTEVAVRGGDRADYAEAVWSMYQESYRSIGLIVTSAAGLTEFDRWSIFMGPDGEPVAFALSKSTPFGVKGGLMGSDGSPAGKGALKDYIRNRYKVPGFYSEVSHAVERLSAGAPEVCNVYVPEVIGKPVVRLEDGVHYQRQLPGVGMVTKKMVGHPRGVPVGGLCPVPEPGVTAAQLVEGGDVCDVLSHHACEVLSQIDAD